MLDRKGRLQPRGDSWASSVGRKGGHICDEAHLSRHISLSGLLWFTGSNQQAYISRSRQCFLEAAVSLLLALLVMLP